MSPPSQEPVQPLILTQIHAWRHCASLKHRHLLLHGMDPARDVREQAFQEMGELCLDALEKVRVLSEQLSEMSEAARIQSTQLLARAPQLMAHPTSMVESQLLQIFKGEQQQPSNPA
jgi:hypothetical protein